MAALGPEDDVTKLPQHLRTVLLVHNAQGVIDNGGLQYFFENDWPGQPPYSWFVAAYQAIGAEREAECLAEAVELFPFDDPHLDREQRDGYLGCFLDEDGCSHRANSPFEPLTSELCGNEEVWTLLAAYVREHDAAFAP